MLRLKNSIDIINKKGIAFLMSYALSRESKILGKGYYSKVVNVRRNIAGFTDKRRIEKEILVSNLNLN